MYSRESLSTPVTGYDLVTADTTKTEKLLQEVICSWRPGAAIEGIASITPDASLRRYYRVSVRGVEVETVVAMVFDSIVCPEAAEARVVGSDEAVVLLTGFFENAGVRVPRLYHDARERSVLLIEDLGSRHLIDVLSHGGQKVEALYRDALAQIVRIQKIPLQEGFFAFGRGFSADTYFKEMLEFTDFALVSGDSESKVQEVLKSGFRRLSEEIEQFRKVLVHRDFHSWNLLVDASDNIRVIDFQDALLGPCAYDVVGLLNDRDTDTALGPELYKRLLNYFWSLLDEPEEFWAEYDRVLLQRDLKVVGRFSKLARVRSLEQYLEWVPGTLRRIGRTLGRICRAEKVEPTYQAMQSVLVELYKEVREGQEDLSFER